MERAPNRLADGFSILDGGMDGGRSPSLIGRNQVAMAINTVFRSGYAECRPAFNDVVLDWQGETAAQTAYEEGKFQGAGYFKPLNGDGMLVVAVSGRLFRISLSGRSNKAQEITVEDGANNARLDKVWMCQAEDFLIIQDGQSVPIIYNGSVARRANLELREVPVGRQMVYGLGRLWIARGRDYIASDIVGGPSGSAVYGFRDAVLKFTENDYLNEGGSFAVPLQSGEITGMKFISNLNTALGQGELIVFTESAVHAVYVPPDRDDWKNLTIPLQRIALNVAGAVSSDSIVNVNSDLFFRSKDGIRSLRMSIRQDDEWGSTPLSREVSNILKDDDERLLDHASSVIFDNRILFTCSPRIDVGRGVFHKGLIALDFDPVGSLSARRSPAYDGLWTGPNVMQLIKGKFDGVERCLAITIDGSEEVFRLHEITKNLKRDNHEDVLTEDTEIEWSIETGEFPFEDGRNALKQLDTADIWLDGMNDECQVTISYRPDQYPLWTEWHSWSMCATTGMCGAPPCTPMESSQDQYRSKRRLPVPANADDLTDGKPLNYGYGFTLRLAFVGRARVRKFRIFAQSIQEPPQGACQANETCSVIRGANPNMFAYEFQVSP